MNPFINRRQAGGITHQFGKALSDPHSNRALDTFPAGIIIREIPRSQSCKLLMRFFVFLAIQRVSPTAGRRGHCASMPSKNPKNGRERLCRSLIFFFLNPIKAQETFALPIDNLLSHFNMVLWSVGALRRARSLTIWDRRSAGSGDKLNRQRFCLGRSGSRPSSRKWLISMIISDNSGKFQMFLGRVVACFGPSKRRHQKEKKHSGTAAGEVCPSPVEVQSHPIKANQAIETPPPPR